MILEITTYAGSHNSSAMAAKLSYSAKKLIIIIYVPYIPTNPLTSK